MSDLLRAMLFAEDCHKEQFRKFSGEPYINHPRRVAAKAVRLGLSNQATCAAFLHDVVEDCGVGLEEIQGSWGHEVAELVRLMSDLQTPKEGNRKERHRKHFQRFVESRNGEAQTLAVLDVIDNARSLMGYAPRFWYSAAKKEAEDCIILFDLAHPEALRELHEILTGDPKRKS